MLRGGSDKNERSERDKEEREDGRDAFGSNIFGVFVFSLRKKTRHITLDIRTNRIKDLETDVEIQH